MDKITSLTNPRVQRVVQLKDKAKAREKAQAFIAEGLFTEDKGVGHLLPGFRCFFLYLFSQGFKILPQFCERAGAGDAGKGDIGALLPQDLIEAVKDRLLLD